MCFKFIFFMLFIVNVNSAYIKTEIKVCIDTERLDFESSCNNEDAQCLQDLSYLKNFQDFSDYYIHFKGKIYHAYEDVIYFQQCSITKMKDIPKNIYECSRDIPLTYIDELGTNRSGYLSQYEVIRPRSTSQIKREICEARVSQFERIVYSLPKFLSLLVRTGTNLDLVPINRVGKAYTTNNELDNFKSYRNNIQNNTYKDISQLTIVVILSIVKIGEIVYIIIKYSPQSQLKQQNPKLQPQRPQLQPQQPQQTTQPQLEPQQPQLQPQQPIQPQLQPQLQPLQPTQPQLQPQQPTQPQLQPQQPQQPTQPQLQPQQPQLQQQQPQLQQQQPQLQPQQPQLQLQLRPQQQQQPQQTIHQLLLLKQQENLQLKNKIESNLLTYENMLQIYRENYKGKKNITKPETVEKNLLDAISLQLVT